MNRRIEKLARTCKVLSDSNRLGIVMVIGKDSRSVTEIINISGLSQTLVSFHLRALRDAGLVKTRRSGPFIYYSLAEPDLLDVLIELAKTVNSMESMTKELPGKPEPIPTRRLERQRRR